MLASIAAILPHSIKTMISRLPSSIMAILEEIRIREQRPLEIIYGGSYAFVTADGSAVQDPHQAYKASKQECLKLLDLLTNHSVYALEEELKRGFITIAGGHRVGLAGRAVTERGKVKLIREINAFNIRIARPVTGCAEHVLPQLRDEQHRTLHHTLIISPPQMGKTTLIRDLSRLVSSGLWGNDRPNWTGRKVGIVDERSEIAALLHGVPQFDVGPRTDVLDRCPKAEGMMMMIRSLSPEVLVVDEIGVWEDAEAVKEAANAGIRVLATAHGESLDQIRSRPMFAKLMEDHTFDRYVVIKRSSAGLRQQDVYDANGRLLSFASAVYERRKVRL